MGWNFAERRFLTDEEERQRMTNAALGGDFAPAFSTAEMAAARKPLNLGPPPIAGLAGVDGYGNPVKRPVWQGYTLNDLVDFAAGEPAVSTVPTGKTGYGLNEVGDASVYHDTKKPFPWKQVAHALQSGLIGLSNPVAAANLNDQRRAGVRRDRLTDSQVAHQGAENDLIGLKILDYPTERAREAEKAALDQELGQKRGSLLDEQIRNLVSGEQRDAEMHPLDMDSEKALAEQRRRPRSSGGSGLDPNSKDYRLELRTRIATLQRMKAAAEREYDHDTADSLGEQINELLNEQARVMEGLYGAPEPGPFPTLTAAPLYAAPPAQRADPLDPQPGETAQQYADRVGPQLGKEARVRWQKAHP